MRYTSVGHPAPTDKDMHEHVQSILMNVEAFAGYVERINPGGGDRSVREPGIHSVNLGKNSKGTK